MTADTEARISSAPPSPALTDFDVSVRTEDTSTLRDYIKKLDKAYHDKSTALRSAYSKVEYLNAETERQEIRINDLVDENKTVKETMRGMADELTRMEKNFMTWQEALITQQQTTQQLLIAEHNTERARIENQVAQLQASLDLASEENLRLQGMVAELSDTTSYVMTLASESENVMHSTDAEYMSTVRRLEEDKRALSEEVINVTKRRVELKVRLEEVEEDLELLQDSYDKEKRENADLRRENEALHERLAKFAGAELSTELEMVGLDD